MSKNKKLIYLLTILILFFTSNLNVRAINEVTCIYDNKLNLNSSETTQFRLKQDINGNITISTRKVSPTEINYNIGWSSPKTNFKFSINGSGYYNRGVIGTKYSHPYTGVEYKSCPKSFYVENDNYGRFYDISTWDEFNNMYQYGTTQPEEFNFLINENVVQHSNSGNSDIPELVCLYARYAGTKKILLKQNSTGQITIELNDKIDAKKDDSAWVTSNIAIHVSMTSEHSNLYLKDVSVNNTSVDAPYDKVQFTQCPKYAVYSEGGWGNKEEIIVSGANTGGYNGLEGIYDDIVIIGPDVADLTCDDLFQGESGKALQNILKYFIVIFKIAIPIMLIALGIIDFSKAIFAGSEDNIKKIQTKFIKRVAIGIVIFLVPSLLKLILTIASNIWGNIDSTFCGLL